jgi:hypothetical protein
MPETRDAQPWQPSNLPGAWCVEADVAGSTPGPFATARRVVVTICWLRIAVIGLFDPLPLALTGQVTAAAFLVIGLGSFVELGTAFAFEEQLPRTRFHMQTWRAVLVVLAACSITGTLTSVVPSMAECSESGVILYEYGLSDRVAPMLWTAILVTSIHAIMVPSSWRLAMAAGAGLVSWPVLVAIHLLRRPWGDFEQQFVVLVPWIAQLYIVVAFVASGLAIALAFGAARLAAMPVMQMPPKAILCHKR